MLANPHLLIGAAFFALVALSLFVIHAFARIEALERKIRHLHRKQDEERRVREDWRSPKVKKVVR